ncbi:MAG: DUF2484 family protein [Pseudomonadota bacterium]
MVSLALGCIWVILVSSVAMMPYPQHRPYALALLVVFPALLMAIRVELGPLAALAFLAAALSIYRHPARFALSWIRRRWRQRRS